MNEELIQIFKDYVATANNPQYGGNWDIINSKFPELSGYDIQLLKDYVATANNPSYKGDWNIINSKFPEFFGDVKKKEPSESTSQEAAMEQPMATGSAESQGFEAENKKPDDLLDGEAVKPLVGQSAYLNDRLSTIDKNLINREEEYVVPQMNYQFGDLGFKFEEAGMTGDWMDVTAPNGQKVQISLDNFLDSKSQAESDRLRKFIIDNTPQKGLFALENTMREEDRKFNSQKQIDDEISKINNEAALLNQAQKDLLLKKNIFEADVAEYLKVPPSQRNTAEFKMKLDDLEKRRDELDKEIQTIIDQEDAFKSRSKALDVAVGKYTAYKSEQGTFGGGIWNSLLSGFSRISSGLTSTTIDIMTEIMPAGFGMSPKDLKDITIEKAAKLGVAPPTEEQTIEDWKKTLTPEQLDDWEDEIDDYIKKDIKGETIPSVRVGLKTVAGDPDTTLEWENLKKQGFWGGAILGLSESIPAMIGGSGPAGWAQRTAQMYSQISDMLSEEMENDPDFEDISESEKFAVTLPIGVVSAVLEAYGLRNVVASSGIIKSITMAALGRAGRGVGAKTFRELVENEVESRLLKGTLIVGAAGLAEFETGALQEVSETTFKAIYNEIKKKDMFQTPESASEFVQNIAVAGAQEAIGGFILGVPTGVSAAYSQKGFLKMNDDSFEMFELMANDEVLQSAYIAKLKEKIANGDITTKEAKEILNNYRNAVGLFRQLPDGLSIQQKKEAMNLLKEKRDLEQYVKGKDDALVVRQKNRINAINEELTKISEQDAVQEQATDEGVLRPEQPEVGLQEMVERDQEPQVTTEEGVEEKITYGPGTIGTLLNERVSYNDPVSGEAVEGDLFVDGQRVVLEAAGGQQFDLGNVDEILGLNIEEAGLVSPAEMAIIPQEDGSFVFNKEGNQKIAKGTTMFNRQPGLQAIRRDSEGKVDRVTLYSEDGAQTYNLTGQEAEDAAYYIVRSFVETQEGQDAINQLAQRNEEARRDLGQPLGSGAVQQAAPQAPAPVRVEALTGPALQAEIADVEQANAAPVVVWDTATPAVEEEVVDEVQAQEVADLAAEMQAAEPAKVERLNRIAERARKAISKITPDVKIIVHDTDAAYREASGDDMEAAYVPTTKTIHINASKARPGAVAHEVFHAVFLDRVKTDAAAQRAAKKMVESIKRVVGEDSELYQYLDEFSQNYDANFQDEEKLAELAAILAENYMSLETSGLSKGAIASFKKAVKDFINTIAKRFGIPMPSTLTDADVVATLNAIAQKTMTGEVITEADVAAIDVLAEPGIVSIRNRKEWSQEYENWASKPKSRAQILGHYYKMNHKGFVDNKINRQQFENDVRGISDRLGVAETKNKSGYYMTLDGKFFNPYKKVIEEKGGDSNDLRQRIGKPDENIFDIVTMARQKGYTDKTIEIYLKQEGFAAEDIKDAMAVNSNIDGAQVPQEFGNVTGGMAQGQTLFDEIKAKLTKMAADGASMMDIRIEAQTLLMDSEVYKAQSAEVKAQLRLSLDATIGTKAADRAFRQEFKQLRAMLADRKKARRELDTIKRMMRGFIRKNLPQGEYSKADVVALLKAIVDANVDTLPLVMEKVEGYVTGFKVRKLEAQIKKLLDTKTTKVDSGRAMGTTTIDVQEDLAALNEKLIDDGMSEQSKEDLLSKQLNDYQTLSSKYDLTDKDIRDLQLLSIAIPYNEAMMLDNDNPVKVESLTLARDRMTVMITVGRSEFKAAQAAKHQAQKKNVIDLVEAITGEPVPFDIESQESIDEYVRSQKVSQSNAEILKGRISKVLGAFAKNPLKAYFDRSASLSNLLGQITANLTDMFGGPVNEMVYGRLKQSDIEFERGMQARSKILESKLKEIYGKDYAISLKQNKISRIIDIFKKEYKADAKKLMDEMKTASFKRKSEIMLELSKMRAFPPLSQNKIYYLYNQFKDESNRAGLETNYGKYYVEYLNELFENYLDPKVREWADWQVNELFPELYDVYNPAYVEIFNTNMPWTANYAGRVYRKGGDETEMAITLMDNKGKFSNIHTPSSTKARKSNRNGIEEMDGDLVLNSYIADMEYFRAYGETIRDVDRMFRNEAVQASIKKVAGEDVLKLIQEYIKIVGTNGMSVGTTTIQGILNSIDSRLGISYMAGSLNQLIKQTTSAFLFAPRIGINNWLAYTAKAAPNMGKTWAEFIDNAPRIVKRYDPKEMSKILGGYDSKRSKKLAESGGITDNRKVLKALDTSGKALDALMWPVIQGDKYSAMVGAMGNYLYYKDVYMQKNPNATEQEIIKFAADKVSTEIEQVLGSSSRIDKDSFQNSGNALYRAFSFLSNSPKAMIRNIVPAYSGLFKKISSFDKTAGPGTLKQNLETVFMFQVFVPVLFKWAAIGLPGLLRDFRDEDDEELGAAAILGPFEALLFIGPLLTLIKDRALDKPWADDMPTVPFFDLVEDIFRQVNKIIKAETDEDLSASEADKLREDGLLNISYIIAGGFGIPAKNIDRMIRNIGEVIDGNEKPGEALLRLFNYSDYTIEGPKKK